MGSKDGPRESQEKVEEGTLSPISYQYSCFVLFSFQFYFLDFCYV